MCIAVGDDMEPAFIERSIQRELYSYNSSSLIICYKTNCRLQVQYSQFGFLLHRVENPPFITLSPGSFKLSRSLGGSGWIHKWGHLFRPSPFPPCPWSIVCAAEVHPERDTNSLLMVCECWPGYWYLFRFFISIWVCFHWLYSNLLTAMLHTVLHATYVNWNY